MNAYRFLPWLVLILAAAVPNAAMAQSQPGSGYALRLLDGQNDYGEHFALARRGTADDWTGFHYVADEQALFAGACTTLCNPEQRVFAGADRGRYVSAANRPALTNRAFAAFYNATSGDLEAADCVDGSCNFAALRVLDTVGDVGVGTATAIDPASGFPYVAYYDASNADLRLYRCTATDCSSGNSLVVDSLGDRGRNPSLAFASGQLWIAYDDVTSGEVRLARGVAPFGVANFVVFNLGPGGDPSISIDSSGFVDLVFRGSTATLERQRCLNSDCSSASQQTIDGAGTGFAPSTTRLPNGNLLVSHHVSASGAIRATVCNDAACSTPQRLDVETGPGFGPESTALAFSNGRPLLIYRDAARTEIRTAQCTSAACTTLLRRFSNGIPAFDVDTAIRADGRPLAIWTKQRLPRIGLCADVLCTSVVYRTPEAANSDSSRPAIAVRPNGRPFAYYSYVGGSAAWDCADAECTTGTLRQVSGTGNSTSNVTELAIRADGRPLMLYYRTTTNDVFLFSCADVDCSSGSERLLANEPDPGANNVSLSGFGLSIGTDGRPLAVWNLSNQPAVGNGALRFARCDDVECTSATLRNLNALPSFGRGALAVRSDNRPVIIENVGNDRNLLTCVDAACNNAARVLLPNPFDIVSNLRLRPGDVPVYSSGTINNGGYWDCGDAACGSSMQNNMISDNSFNQRGFTGRLAFNGSDRPVQAFAEQDLRDIWLAVPLPDAVFANGFEN
jgi:hypothetical protein